MIKRPYGKLTAEGGAPVLRDARENAGAGRGLSIASRAMKKAPLGGVGASCVRGALTKIFPIFPALGAGCLAILEVEGE